MGRSLLLLGRYDRRGRLGVERERGGGLWPVGGGSPTGGTGPFFDAERSPICAEQWCWENPYPHGRLNRALWVAAPDDLWIAGDGPLLRFDGTTFTTYETPEIGQHNAIWGSGPDTIWLVGADGIAQFDGTAWSATSTVGGTDVHGSGPNDVWVVGAGSTQRWDGSAWSEPAAAPVGEAVWVESATSRWVLGSSAWHYAADTWQEVTWPTAATAVAVAAASGSDIWVVGMTSADPLATVLFHGDGSSFEPVAPPLDDEEAVTGVWAAAADDVWLSTTRDVWHGDGEAWTPGPWPPADDWTDYLRMPSATGALADVAGASSTQVWAVGETGQVLRFDGDHWAHVDTRLPLTGRPVWYDDSGLWFSPGGWGLVRVDAGGLEQFDTEKLNAIWADGQGTMWGVGDSGYIVRVHDGETQEVRSGTGWWLNAIAGSGPNDVWAVGASETILRWDGELWQTDSHDFNKDQDFADVATVAPDQVWVTGPWYSEVWHWDGTEWGSLGGNKLDGIALSVPTAECVWLGATDGEVLRYQETAACTDGAFPLSCWSAPYEVPTWLLHDVYARSCNEAWAVGEGGVIWHVRDDVETSIAGGRVTESNLQTLLIGPDGRLFTFGDDGAVLSHEP